MNPALHYQLFRLISDRHNDTLESHETIKLYIALDEN
jgi:hypothetical protein